MLNWRGNLTGKKSLMWQDGPWWWKVTNTAVNVVIWAGLTIVAAFKRICCCDFASIQQCWGFFWSYKDTEEIAHDGSFVQILFLLTWCIYPLWNHAQTVWMPKHRNVVFKLICESQSTTKRTKQSACYGYWYCTCLIQVLRALYLSVSSFDNSYRIWYPSRLQNVSLALWWCLCWSMICRLFGYIQIIFDAERGQWCGDFTVMIWRFLPIIAAPRK